jgi:hypothetical protein
MKPKRNSRSIGSNVIAGIAFLIIITAFLLGPKGTTKEAPFDTTYADNVSGKADNQSTDCPDSSSGIPLCELTPDQRQKEELKDRLNRELEGMLNGTQDDDPYAPAKKPSMGVIISPTNSVRLKVGIPAYDHASLVAEDLKNAKGISDIYWSPPDLFDIKYDAAMTSVDEILSREILRRYNASVVSSV